MACVMPGLRPLSRVSANLARTCQRRHVARDAVAAPRASDGLPATHYPILVPGSLDLPRHLPGTGRGIER